MKNKLFTAGVLAFLCAFNFQNSNLCAGPFINGAFIKGANLPWLDGAYGHDIGTTPVYPTYTCAYNSTDMNQAFTNMHAMGITVVRLWLNEEEQGLVLNGSGNVTGLQPLFLTNLDNIIHLAATSGISMYLTLANSYDSDGSDGISLLTDSTLQSSYIANAIIPLATRYKGNTNIFAFDVMNEIDALSPFGYGEATWAQIQSYVSSTVSAIHTADPTRLASCSLGFGPAWPRLFQLKGLGMDFYDFHDYEDVPQNAASFYAGDTGDNIQSFPTAAGLALDKPILIGECGQYTETLNDTIQNTCILDYLGLAKTNAFAGALVWAYGVTGGDPEYLTMLNPNGSWRPVCYSIQSFSYNNPPVISTIAASGTVGTAITITGQNFTGATAVSFNGALAVFTVISATQISAIVPFGATSGDISVTTAAGIGQSVSSFTVLALPANAPAFATLNNFIGVAGSAGSDPYAGLVLSGNTLYGTAQDGGTNGGGTVFAVNINANGTGAVTLHNFNGASDGMNPRAALFLSGQTLYGTAQYGIGPSGPDDLAEGKLFALNTNGTGFTNLLTFGPSGTFTTGNAGNPNAVILSGGTLYGTAQDGGAAYYGTVFAVNTNGTGYTNLYSFTNGSDGGNPVGSLILSGNMLYGTASGGGANGSGSVFAINISGTGFTTLYSFTALGSYPNPATNSDGAYPNAGLILSGSTLYGTASAGGSPGNGTVFSLNINGTGFSNLHNFAMLQTNLQSVYTNGDGASPNAGLIQSGSTLYGVASAGGTSGNGTVFSLSANGSNFTTLYDFTAFNNGTNSDGAAPEGTLLFAGNTLYGTASQGGPSGNGTVFSLSFPTIAITLIRAGTNVILTWPTNNAALILQTATNLNAAVWTTVTPAPIVVSGQNTVTNAISGPARFYRLN